jgi:hypothetical protein
LGGQVKDRSASFISVSEGRPGEEAPSVSSNQSEASNDQDPVGITKGLPTPAPISTLPLFASAHTSSSSEEAWPDTEKYSEGTLDRDPKSAAPVKSSSSGLLPGSYMEFGGKAGDDPRTTNKNLVSEGLVKIIEAEGPVVAKRV